MSPLNLIARADGAGEAYWFLDGLSVVRLSGKETGGAFALIEDTLPPGRATPLHLHHREDESFYVLEGELTFFTRGQRIRATDGTTIFLPRGEAHGFRAETAARLLILTTPAGFDGFVAEAGEPALRRELPEPKEPDFARLTTLAAKYGIDILGPLPE